MKLLKKFAWVFLLLALSFSLVWLARQSNILQNLEAESYDLRVLAFAPPTKASDDVVMVWLDEPTMRDLLYRSPIPRDFLAMLTDKLAEAQPKFVAYDIFFKDPSFPEGDAAFAQSLAKVHGYGVVPLRETFELEKPLPIFFSALDGLGLADLPFNPYDATVRAFRVEFPSIGGPFPAFATRLYNDYQRSLGASDSVLSMIANPQNWLHVGPLSFAPYWSNDRTLAVRYAGPPSKMGGEHNAFKIYSASMVARGLVPADWLKDKIVFVGAGYDDLKDAFLTPYYSRLTNFHQMNGVEIHANIFSSLLTKQFYYFFSERQETVLLAACLVLVALSVMLLSLGRATVLFVLFSAAYAVGAALIFQRYGLVTPLVSPLFAMTTCFAGGLGLRALTEGRQKRWIKSVFAHYVPPQVVERMSENPALLSLGGEERLVTSFFSDIASFTSVSEKLDPQTLVQFLNDYLGKMNQVLFAHGATVDKYEGDAIIAFFNAPLDLAQHQEKAVRAALAMQLANDEVAEQWSAKLGAPLITRMGLNTGRAVVGNMGSAQRFDYTAIGDTINLASRLEGANKFYGSKILCTEFTAEALPENIFVRPVDRVQVKGKNEAVLIYEVLGSVDELTREHLMKPYLEAFDHFERRDLNAALELIQRVLAHNPHDVPAQQLQERILRAMKDPTWNLITSLNEK